MRLERHLKGSPSLRLVSKLNLAAYRNSLAHSTKGTPSHRGCGAPTACGRPVSGTVSLPSRGAFHLSLTVLVRYRSQESVQPWRVVPPDSRRVSRARRYSGADAGGRRRFGYGALTRSGRPSQAVPLRRRFLTARGPRVRPLDPSHDPSCSNPPEVCACMGLGWSAFARRYSRNLG